MTVTAPAAAYVAFFEALTPENLGELRGLCIPQIHFRDPFNDLIGIDRFVAVFEEMFATIETPGFAVEHYACADQVCYLRWVFTGSLKSRQTPFEIVGMSEVHFDDSGRVTAHIDHWDAAGQVYENFPLIGGLLRFFRRRFSLKERPNLL